MVYTQFPIEEAAVGDLRLDVSNYRFSADQPTETAALNYLFATAGVMDVARIILRDGYVDNEVPLVVEEDGGLVILEGNRRLSALRALLDPSLVPSHQVELDLLLRRYPLEAAELPKQIRVMLCPSRETAAPVLARMHIGENKKAWNLDEQANFVRAQLTDGVTVRALKEQLPAIKDVGRLIRMGHIRDMLNEVSLGDPALEEYAVSDKLPMSSFEYAYKNREIQAAIGISFDGESSLSSRPSTAAHIAALTRLLRGFKAGELNTRRGLKPDTNEFDQLVAEMRGEPVAVQGKPTASATQESAGSGASAPTASTDDSASGGGASSPPHKGASNGADAAGATQDQSPRRGPNKPETKKTLDITGVDESQLPLTLKYRIRELRRIDVFEFPAAAAMLMRSVLEAAIKEHYGLKGNQGTGMLSDVMKQVTIDYGKHGQLSHAIGVVNRTGRGKSNTPGTGEWFNLITHSVNIGVNGSQVHEAWNAVFPLVRFLLTP